MLMPARGTLSFTMTSTASDSAGARFRSAVAEDPPLQIAGAVNAYAGRLAESAGFKALYVSGGGVSACSLGVPDLGLITLDDVLTDVRRLTRVTELPVLVDIDTGWGGEAQIAQAVRELSGAGAAAIHIEDQVELKRCGHLPGKSIVSREEMVERVAAAAAAKPDPDFVVMARTDAVAVEGLDAALERAAAYIDAGADMLFPEALASLDDYRAFTSAAGVPVLANITEFGRTPLFTVDELAAAGVQMVLYPLSAFRAMSRAALQVYQSISNEGTQKNVVELMQPRVELYEFLDYQRYEAELMRAASGKES